MSVKRLRAKMREKYGEREAILQALDSPWTPIYYSVLSSFSALLAEQHGLRVRVHEKIIQRVDGIVIKNKKDRWRWLEEKCRAYHGFQQSNTKAKSLEPFPISDYESARARELSLKKDFYTSNEWRVLRYKALKLSNGLCCNCGRGPQHGIILHVDHILPRSRYPEYALSLKNLQVLCDECNLGKGAWDETDWRR